MPTKISHRVKWRWLLLSLAGFFLLLFLHAQGLIPGEWIFGRLFSPIASRVWRSGITLRQWLGVSRAELLSRMTILEAEQAQLLAERTELLLLKEENSFLRSQISLKESSERPLLAARVIGRRFDIQGTTILLDRGSEDGVLMGLPVVVEGRIFIGKVIKVERSFAHVQLLTHPQSNVAAMILNQEKSPGLIQGERGLTTMMTLIPRDHSIRSGDTIVTSGLEPLIPSGLFIGTVDRIITQSSDLFQTASMHLPISFDMIMFASIVLPP